MCAAAPAAPAGSHDSPRPLSCPICCCLPRFTRQRLLQEHGEVHLSALGIACSSMVTVAEILKARK